MIIVRNIENSEQLLKKWIQTNRVENTNVAGSKLFVHDQRAFDLFLVSWTHGWDNIVIWDAWNRRHIYI
jgi:hypothetical protein